MSRIPDKCRSSRRSWCQSCLCKMWAVGVAIIPIVNGCTEQAKRSPSNQNEASSRDHVDENDAIRTSPTKKSSELLFLESKPLSIEPELLRGKWLMVIYSTLSAEDISTAHRCPEIARRLDGELRVAVRRTRDFTETGKWLPRYDEMEPHASPLWVLMRDGVVMGWYAGGMSDAEAIAFVHSGLKLEPSPTK